MPAVAASSGIWQSSNGFELQDIYPAILLRANNSSLFNASLHIDRLLFIKAT